MAPSGGDDVVLRPVLLQHQPHRPDVVAGEAPVAAGVEVAERQRVGQPPLDARGAAGDLAGDELQPAPRRLVVEEDAGDREQPVALAVVDRDVMREDLGDAVGAARIEGRRLGLGRLAHLAEHLARRRLVDADRGVRLANRLQHAGDALRVVLAGQQRLVPRGRHEGHRGQVVELVRPHVLDQPDEGELVQQIGGPQLDAVEQVLDAPVVRGAEAAGDPDHLVPPVEEQLGEVRTVLAGDAGDDRAFRHVGPTTCGCAPRPLPRARCGYRPPAARRGRWPGSRRRGGRW